jgi:hypothetical protein
MNKKLDSSYNIDLFSLAIPLRPWTIVIVVCRSLFPRFLIRSRLPKVASVVREGVN